MEEDPALAAFARLMKQSHTLVANRERMNDVKEIRKVKYS